MTSKAAEFWDKQVAQPTHNSWMAPLRARLYINEMVSGRAGGWPLDWLQEWLKGRRFARALSVGCGTGALERDLILRDMCDRIDAFDGSTASLEIARREADAAGYSDRIHYAIGDFNEPSLPRRTYDAVFFHQSAHHVGKLEKLYRALLEATTPDAIVYLDEFVGPSRAEWNADLLSRWEPIYQSLPPSARLFERLRLPVEYDDPSEAVRSAEIVDQLRIGFDVQAFRGYGGNVLSVVFPQLVPAEISDAMLAGLIETEKRWLQQGDPHFHAIVVATPKRSAAARLAARLRYTVEPKLRRAAREISGRLRSR